MAIKLLVFLLSTSLLFTSARASFDSVNVIPIQPGVPNTISFACAPISGSSSSSTFGASSLSGSLSPLDSSSSDLSSLISSLTAALSSGTGSSSVNPSGYTYKFSGLPSWVSSINGPIISGTPPSSGSNSYTITITISAGNGQSTSQNVILSPPVSRTTFGSGSFDSSFASALQVGNIYNPLNPGSPYNPYNPFNPNGVNFGGSTGSLNVYYSGL